MKDILKLNETVLEDLIGSCEVLEFENEQDFLQFLYEGDEEVRIEIENNGLIESSSSFEEGWLPHAMSIMVFLDKVWYEKCLFTYNDKLYLAYDPDAINDLLKTPLETSLEAFKSKLSYDDHYISTYINKGYITLSPKAVDHICSKVKEFIIDTYRKPDDIVVTHRENRLSFEWDSRKGLSFVANCKVTLEGINLNAFSTSLEFRIELPLELMKGDVE